MPCYQPIKAYRFLDKFGESVIKFVSKDVFDKTFIPSIYSDLSFVEKLELPCGKCIGCRLDYSRTWAIRCMLEAQNHKHNWFLTLTYDDEHVPTVISDTVNIDSGEYFADDCISYTLKKEHISAFLKRLRSYIDYHHIEHDDVRFYSCGEYGDKSFRPHYHMILFGCDIPDLEFFSKRGGNLYFTSEIINSLWSHGFVIIGELSFQSASYVARYCTKKTKIISKDFYEKNGISPEFTLMSRRPGISRDYYDRNSDKIYNLDSLTVVGSGGSPLVVRPPRYFDRLFELDKPVTMDTIKKERQKNSKYIQKAILANTSLNKDEYLAVQHKNKLAVISQLKRSVF